MDAKYLIVFEKKKTVCTEIFYSKPNLDCIQIIHLKVKFSQVLLDSL